MKKSFDDVASRHSYKFVTRKKRCRWAGPRTFWRDLVNAICWLYQILTFAEKVSERKELGAELNYCPLGTFLEHFSWEEKRWQNFSELNRFSAH